MTIQLLAGVGLFALGLLIGALLQRSFNPDKSKCRRVEQKLAETQEAYTKYQAEVSAHFMDTARKVQNLNNSYREVHEQLAKGASKLCGEEESKDFLAISAVGANKGATYEEDEIEQLAAIEQPPMDYAPKETPDDEGTLSESYGLKETNAPENETETSPEPSATESAATETSLESETQTADSVADTHTPESTESASEATEEPKEKV